MCVRLRMCMCVYVCWCTFAYVCVRELASQSLIKYVCACVCVWTVRRLCVCARSGTAHCEPGGGAGTAGCGGGYPRVDWSAPCSAPCGMRPTGRRVEKSAARVRIVGISVHCTVRFKNTSVVAGAQYASPRTTRALMRQTVIHIRTHTRARSLPRTYASTTATRV